MRLISILEVTSTFLVSFDADLILKNAGHFFFKGGEVGMEKGRSGKLDHNSYRPKCGYSNPPSDTSSGFSCVLKKIPL